MPSPILRTKRAPAQLDLDAFSMEQQAAAARATNFAVAARLIFAPALPFEFQIIFQNPARSTGAQSLPARRPIRMRRAVVTSPAAIDLHGCTGAAPS